MFEGFRAFAYSAIAAIIVQFGNIEVLDDGLCVCDLYNYKSANKLSVHNEPGLFNS